jgi:DNA-binding MarR family transcriptional regulator
MSSLAILTSSEQSRLSHLMKRMEAKGLARREKDPANGRQTNAHITEKGWESIREAAPGHVAAVRSLVFDVLSPKDVQAMSRACQRILEQLGPYRAG